MQEGIAGIDQLLEQLEMAPDAEGYEEQKAACEQQRAELEQQLTMIQSGLEEIAVSKGTLEEQLNQAAASLGQESAEQALAYIAEQSTVIWNTLEELGGNETKLPGGAGSVGCRPGRAEQGKAGSGFRQDTAFFRKIEMETKKLLGAIEMSVAESRLNSGSMQLPDNRAAVGIRTEGVGFR